MFPTATFSTRAHLPSRNPLPLLVLVFSTPERRYYALNDEDGNSSDEDLLGTSPEVRRHHSGRLVFEFRFPGVQTTSYHFFCSIPVRVSIARCSPKPGRTSANPCCHLCVHFLLSFLLESHFETETETEKGGGYAAWATSRKRGKTDPDSHNYEPDESEVWRTHQAQRHFRDRGRCAHASRLVVFVLVCL